jgi:4-hydroxybenzoate polyprenyltransferase
MTGIRRFAKVAQSLLRVPTYLLLLMYLVVGWMVGLLVSHATPDASDLAQYGLKLGLCAATIALWYINGTALNDYADYEIDLINLKGDKDRPLVVGTATRQDLLHVAAMAYVGAVALAAAVSWRHALFVAVLFALNVSYSIKPFQVSRRGGVAPLILPLGYVALPFFLGYELTTSHWTMLAFGLVAAFYLQFLGRIILKDYRDVKGDKAHGKLTFLLRHGNAAVCMVSACSTTASALALLWFVGASLGTFRIVITALVGFGLVVLLQLSQVPTWPQQKPLLAAFGRAMTGVTAAVIAGFAVLIWEVPKSEAAVIALVLAIVYLWSAREAFAYNAHRMSAKTPTE